MCGGMGYGGAYAEEGFYNGYWRTVSMFYIEDKYTYVVHLLRLRGFRIWTS